MNPFEFARLVELARLLRREIPRRHPEDVTPILYNGDDKQIGPSPRLTGKLAAGQGPEQNWSLPNE